ncbi:MAG: hypothetical protein EBV03_03625 [Proteobacteria bacterium]|nr:hypothetical protein [Pseudomonadota bacterium]
MAANRVTPDHNSIIRGVYAQDELRLFNAGLVFSQKKNTNANSLCENSYTKDYTRGSDMQSNGGVCLVSFQVPGAYTEAGDNNLVPKLQVLAKTLLAAKGIPAKNGKAGSFYVELTVPDEETRRAAAHILQESFTGGSSFSPDQIMAAKAAPRPADIPKLPRKYSPINSLFDTVPKVLSP